jgi:membrane protein
VGIVSIVTHVVAPVVLAFITLGGVTGLLVEALRWLIAVTVLLAGVGVLYRFGPNRNNSHARRSIKSGAVVAVVSWAALSVAFSYYVANFGNYNQVYGSIGAVIAMLVWLWLSSFLILLGAVVNAQVEKHVYGEQIAEAASPFGDLIDALAEEQADGTPALPLP